jgi:hypothetical protein
MIMLRLIMKSKLLLIIVLLAFIPVFSFSQILIGVKGGYNFSAPLENPNGNPDDADLSITKNSYLISAFYKSRIPKKVVNLGFEAEYYKTGLSGHQRDGGLGSGTIYDYNFTLHFLNLIVKPEFVFGSKFKFIINSGAYFGILLKVNTTGNWKTYGPPPASSGEINETKNHYFNTLNFGFLGGFGAEYPVSNRLIINLEANYTFGITNLASSSLSSVFFNLINAQLSLGLAYKINWIRKSDKEKKKIDWLDK